MIQLDIRSRTKKSNSNP